MQTLGSRGIGLTDIATQPVFEGDRPLDTSTRPNWLRITMVALVMVLALAVRVYRLGDENFWVDEVYQVRVASQSLVEIARNYHPSAAFGKKDQAPLSMMVGHFFIRDDRTEFWARIPSAVFGTFNVLALFLVSRQLLPFSPSLMAALFLALSPLSVWYSQEARWYALWGLGTTLAYLALLRAEATRSPMPWIAYGVLTVVNLYTFIYAIFVIAAQWLSLVWRQRTEPGSTRPLVVFSVVTLAALTVAAPVVAMIVGSVGEGKVYSGTPRNASVLEFPYTFLCYCTGFTLGPSLARLHASPGPIQILREHPEVGLVFLVFTPVSLLGLLSVSRRPRLASWVVPWLFTIPILVFLTGGILPEMTYQVRYTFASLPAFTLLLAVGVYALDGRLRLTAAGAVLALSVHSLSNLHWAESYDRADVRGAVTYMTSKVDHPREVVVVGQIRDTLPYYVIGKTDLDVVFCGSREHEDFPFIDLACTEAKFLEGKVDTTRGVWLVAGRDWAQEHKRCLRILLKFYSVAEHTTFTGVDLWRLEPHSSGS